VRPYRAGPLFLALPLTERADAHVEDAGKYGLAHVGLFAKRDDFAARRRLEPLDLGQIYMLGRDLVVVGARHQARAA
jgi:hypothetical protein